MFTKFELEDFIRKRRVVNTMTKYCKCYSRILKLWSHGVKDFEDGEEVEAMDSAVQEIPH